MVRRAHIFKESPDGTARGNLRVVRPREGYSKKHLKNINKGGNNQWTKPEREHELIVYDCSKLAAHFTGPRCMNCEHAYDFAPFIIGACKCRIAPGERVDRKLYDINGRGDIARKNPWGLDKGCKEWKEAQDDRMVHRA